MRDAIKSSDFTISETGALGPPLIGALLRIPWETVRRRMLERLHEQGFDDIDTPHLNVFLYPGPQGERPSELAARMGVSKQALNYLLGELERLGYLERRADPHDRRSRRIALTRRGESAGHAMREAVVELEHEWEARLGRKRFAQLQTLLRELAGHA
ncbi:MAG: MarR family transcriptional regulator [Gaiella sp.]|nr:MarR family transcriptional regulator [Gaiella sp.]